MKKIERLEKEYEKASLEKLKKNINWLDKCDVAYLKLREAQYKKEYGVSDWFDAHPLCQIFSILFILGCTPFIFLYLIIKTLKSE